MSKKLEMYKCDICGTVLEVLIPGVGDLMCCDVPMDLLTPKNSENDDGLTEKHTPEFESNENGTIIKMTKHPMTQEHYIMFMQAQDENKNEVHITYSYPEQTPTMNLPKENNLKKAFSYCNLHGIYES